MATAGALTDPDVAALRVETATGRTVTVWFTAAAVGVPAGGSAKVVSVGDTSDGDFIQVRPAGTRDTMFCAPNELTRTRPARRRGSPPPPPAAPARSTARRAAVEGRSVGAAARGGAAAEGGAVAGPAVTTMAGAGTPAATEPGPVAPGPVAPGAAVRGPAVPGAAVPGAVAPGPAVSTRAAAVPASRPVTGGSAAAPPATRAAARPRRRADPTGELRVSLTATADGEWSVEVQAGTKRIVAATPVPAAAVATAARSLPGSVAEAIESSLEAARQRQRDRVERLRAELDAAQQVLDQLGR